MGNPGAEFERSRHNVGAEVVALLATRHGQRLRPEKGTRSTVANVDIEGRAVVLAVPQTYVNESGLAVAALVRRFGVDDARRVVVVHDELDLPNGRVKIKAGGGTAGHNGLESVHAHLHDNAYLRVRIGVGKPPGSQQGADYVLRRPGRAAREQLEVAEEIAADAVEVIAASGVEAAMQRFNSEPLA
ncbi:MAG TPA: aminoacyl-tRNA hydrolase [Acidimicrobiales bacterium]|nr:aminoacyl-tRNA hydrolase [Acidimicrobiales bacterium]